MRRIIEERRGWWCEEMERGSGLFIASSCGRRSPASASSRWRSRALRSWREGGSGSSCRGDRYRVLRIVGRCLTWSASCGVLCGRGGRRRRLRRLRAAVGKTSVSAVLVVSCGVEWERRGVWARSQSMGTTGYCGRAAGCPCRLWHPWPARTRRVLGRAGLLRVQGWYGRAQWC